MMMSTSADQRNSYSYVSAERRAPLAKRTPIRKNQRSIVPTASADLSFLDDASSIASIPMVDKMASSHPTMAQLPLADKTMENELLFDEGEISLILPPTLIPESLAAVGGGLLKEQDRALDASKREIFSLKLKIYHLEERLRRVTQPAGILHEQLEAQNQELMAQKQQLETQSQQLTTLTRQNESLTVENLTLTRENSALAQRLSTIAEEKSSLVKEGSKLVAEGETIARARDAALAALEAERAMYMEAMERSNQELEHLRVEATIRAREIEHQRFLAQAEVEEAMGRASDTEHRTAVLERKLAEQQDEARQLLDRVAREREVQEAELVRLHTELQQTVATHQQEMAHLTTKLEEERRQRALTIKEATCLQPDTKRQFEALEAELQHTNKELDDTRMQLVRARAELQQVIERKQQEFTSEREALRLEKDALRVAQDSLRAEKEMLRTQREIFVSEYDSDRNSLERQLGEATRALGDAARSYAQSERAREEASRGRRTAEAEVQRLNAELCAIREEATHFLGAYSRERSTENATITALTNERDSLREELQVLRLNAETETASLARFKAEAETERARLQSGFSAQLTRSMEKLRDCELELLRERATIERYERTMAQERDRFTSELQALRATLNDTTKNSTENNREHVHHSNISTDTSLGLIIDAIVAGLSQRLNGTTIQSEAIATDAAVAHLDHLQVGIQQLLIYRMCFVWFVMKILNYWSVFVWPILHWLINA